jgi:beta-glucosidase-like glycosyl hydrolase
MLPLERTTCSQLLPFTSSSRQLHPTTGLPSINLEDGPQGVADGLNNVTQWPSQLTVSMTWSPELMYLWGVAMGAEQRAKGTNVMLGPDVNLARVPWSGRVFETMGEVSGSLFHCRKSTTARERESAR